MLPIGTFGNRLLQSVGKSLAHDKVDAFEVLARDKLLQPAPEVKNPQAPAKVGNYPLNDPEGMYYGQALAGYGLMWNTRYMQANKVPAPKEWADLIKGEYFGHVAMSSPSRSGRFMGRLSFWV